MYPGSQTRYTYLPSSWEIPAGMHAIQSTDLEAEVLTAGWGITDPEMADPIDRSGYGSDAAWRAGLARRSVAFLRYTEACKAFLVYAGTSRGVTPREAKVASVVRRSLWDRVYSEAEAFGSSGQAGIDADNALATVRSAIQASW